MLKKRLFIAALLLAALGSAMLHAAATSVIQKDGLVYVPDHSIFFADVDKSFSWAVHPVDHLANKQVLSGTSDMIYRPEKSLIRADFAAMLTRAYHMEDFVGGGSFADVPGDAYYSDAVSAAKNLGIISGDEYGKFNPTNELTRQDAMVMLRRTLDRAGFQLASGSLDAFSDASDVSDYAKRDVAALANAGVINGFAGKLSPKAPVSRAEMAVMLYRAMMLEPDEAGNPVYIDRSNVVNVCIGQAFYPNVVVENALDGQTLGGLYNLVEMRGQGEDYVAQLGAPRALDQTIHFSDGALLVNGELVSTAENISAICVSPYSLIASGLVSTGGEYQRAAVSMVDGTATAVYYTR